MLAAAPRGLASANVDPEKVPVIEEYYRRFPFRADRSGFAAHATHEQQSLLVPSVTYDVARSFGFTDEQFRFLSALRIRSAMAVPFRIRGETRGAMVFTSSSRQYEPEDLRFAEIYVQRVALGLENARLYKIAQDAVKSRDDFLTMASHELRTPLATLCLSAEALAHEAGTLPERTVAQMTERMVRQIGRLDRLADRLLNASEIGRRRPSIDREVGDLTEMVDDVAHAFRSRAEAAGSSLQLSSDGHVSGSFDPIRLQQVLGNLIDNAIKFGTGKPIEIDVRAKNGVATVSVHDHGPGIPLDEQRLLFTRFDPGAAADGLGGLGLFLVREIIAAHGGRLRLDTQPGQGTTFIIELPLQDPDSPPR
jgi:signal transduction histidine kinase